MNLWLFVINHSKSCDKNSIQFLLFDSPTSHWNVKTHMGRCSRHESVMVAHGHVMGYPTCDFKTSVCPLGRMVKTLASLQGNLGSNPTTYKSTCEIRIEYHIKCWETTWIMWKICQTSRLTYMSVFPCDLFHMICSNVKRHTWLKNENFTSFFSRVFL